MTNIFAIWAIATGVYVLVMSYRTQRFARALFSLTKQEIDENQKLPRLSVVIPACNEAKTLGGALTSLLATTYPNLEIILVNDRSTDETGAVIEALAKSDRRVRPLHVKELPKGWLGKVHAMSKGLDIATGEFVLITDADVHFGPQALMKAMTFALNDNLDFLTIFPNFTSKSKALKIMLAQLFHQASLMYNLKRMNDPAIKLSYGQGAFLMFRKSVYETSAKLDWLKMEAVDDTGFALLMRNAGARVAAVAGLGEVQLEWYPCLKGFIRGLEKNAFAFSQYSFLNLSVFLGFSFLTFGGLTVAPFFCGSRLLALFLGAGYGVYMHSIFKQLSRMMDIGYSSVLGFPLASLALPLIFLRAAVLAKKRGGIFWRGTFYSLADLKANQRMKLVELAFPNPFSSQAKAPAAAVSVELS